MKKSFPKTYREIAPGRGEYCVEGLILCNTKKLKTLKSFEKALNVELNALRKDMVVYYKRHFLLEKKK